MSIKLYVLPASHPCAAVEEAMRLKNVSYKRIDLLPMVQVLAGPLLYRGTTVPGMRIERERLVGSRNIMRRLDALTPDPPLLPADPEARGRVLDAERWGDEVFQSVPRRILDAGFLRDPGTMESYADNAEKLPLPRGLLRPALPLTAKLMARRNHAEDAAVRADFAELPAQLAKIDGWIAEGLLGGEHPNAADLQIGSTVRLLATIGDVRPLLAGHRATELVRYFPPLAGEVPAGILPAEWVPAGAAA